MSNLAAGMRAWARAAWRWSPQAAAPGVSHDRARQPGDSHPRRPQANGGAVRVLVLAIPAGLLIGLSLGALGGGGSILTVPALVYLLHQPAHGATTGSLLIVGITALAGMAAHARAGHVRLAQGMLFGLLGVAGSYAGTRLSASADPHLLLTAFPALC